MKTKRILSLFIIISMMMGLLGFSVHSEETEENPQISIIHNIAQKYTGEAILTDENIHWFLADLADYLTVYPNSEHVMSEEVKQAALDKVIDFADTASAPGDLAKSIIALRSMGYDAKKVTTKNLTEIDIVQKLTALVDEQSEAVTNIYTLPFVIIALQQGENYATETQMNWLLNKAISQKNSWQDTLWGPDSVAFMVAALSPYYDIDNDTKNITPLIDESVEIIKSCQTDSGMMSDSVCSTGMSMWALAYMGINPETILTNGKNMIDGIMPYVTETLDGFNQWGISYDTEQAFRGLVSWQLAKQNKTPYNFKDYPLNEAKASVEAPTPPANPEIFYPTDDSAETVSVKISVMIHNEDECNNSYTYKNNSDNYTKLLNQTIIAESGISVFDALVEALSLRGIDYIESGNGYISSIDGIGEFDHGDKSGWMFMVNGEQVNTGSSSTFLTEDSTVVWFYTDNYMIESSSEDEIISDDITEEVEEESEKDVKEDIKEDEKTEEELLEPQKPEFTENTYSDVKKTDWHYDAVKYAYENNLMTGTGNGFEPDTKMTRAMLVTVLYRLHGTPKTSQTSDFSDIEKGAWYEESVLWASENNIVLGINNTEFAPNQELSREQMAVILYRYANSIGINTNTSSNLDKYLDKEEISNWAVDALIWANSVGLINGMDDNKISPKESATRAQIATILMRFCETIYN